MKTKTLLTTIAAASLLASHLVTAAAPPYLNYQGILNDASGAPLTGQHEVHFNLYNAPTEGALIWGPFVMDGSTGDGHALRPSFSNGKFSAALGDKDTDGDLLNAVDFGATVYVEITVDGNILSPRQRLLSAPFAIQAQRASHADRATNADQATNATHSDSATLATTSVKLTPTSAATGWNIEQEGNKLVTRWQGTEYIHVSEDGRVLFNRPANLRSNSALAVGNGHVTLDPDHGCMVINSSGDFVAGFDTDGGNDLHLYADGASRVQLLHDRMIPQQDNIYNLGSRSNAWVRVYSNLGVTETSDRRLKDNIQPIHHGIDTVMNLRPVEYTRKSHPENGMEYGFIAQEVQELLPEIVLSGDDESEYLSMTYTKIIPVLVKAMQEQQVEVEKLKAEIQRLSGK